MNYIQEINSFYNWLESNPLPKNAIALWHALMAVNNKTGWISDFTVSLSALELKTGMNKTEICKARARLESEHRIKWAKRGGTSCAVYTLLAFEKQVNCKTIGESNGNINKLNKTKHKQNKTINSNDNKLSFVINKIDDANSNFKISKRKSVFDLKNENFEAPLVAKQNPAPTSENEIQILTGGAALDDELEMMDEDLAAVTAEEACVSEVDVDDDNREIVKLDEPITKINYKQYFKHFNNRCKRLSRVTVLTKQRRTAIRARLQEYDHQTILKMINEAAESDFLSGENHRGWMATFDWLFRPNNFVKVLEGNYANGNMKFQGGIQNGYKPSHFELIKEAYDGIMEEREIPIDFNSREV